MPLQLTTGQYTTAKQTIQNKFARIELLNSTYQIVDELSGVVIEGSFTVDANADVRRTGSISLVVTDSSFEIQSGGKIWLDKYVRVFSGTEHLITGEIEWTNLGIYIIDEPSYTYNASTNTLDLTLVDLMAKMNGTRNGYREGIPVVLKAGENIRSAIISTLTELGGFTRYIVEEAPSPGTIPMDLNFGQEATVYDLLVGLKEIYPKHEIFFDVNGVFHYQSIPTGAEEPVSVSDDLWQNIVISESVNTSFQDVKNVIEVYGRVHTPERYATATTVSGNTLNLTIASVTQYTQGVIYGFTTPTGISPTTITTLQINSLGNKPVRIDGGGIITVEADTYYCVQYLVNEFRWLGHLQAYGYAEDNNPLSPFYINGTVGKIRLPLLDGDYANCFTDDLARQRAEYELFLHTRMNDSISLTCVPVPWLDVNILVEYTKRGGQIPSQYLIKNISLGLGESDTMNVNMISYYPEP